jgi:hypothetical protein
LTSADDAIVRVAREAIIMGIEIMSEDVRLADYLIMHSKIADGMVRLLLLLLFQPLMFYQTGAKMHHLL